MRLKFCFALFNFWSELGLIMSRYKELLMVDCLSLNTETWDVGQVLEHIPGVEMNIYLSITILTQKNNNVNGTLQCM